MRGRSLRALGLIAVWAVLSAALSAHAEGPTGNAISESAPKVPRGAEGSPPRGALSADKKSIATGETVRLLLRISGEGKPSACIPEQPDLPALTHLKLLTVSQRNEVAFHSGAQVLSTIFLYTLEAQSPGRERIPAIQVKYKTGGDSESRTIAVEGLEIVVGEGGHINRRIIALIVLVGAGGALLGAAWRMRARKVERGAGGMEAVAPGGLVAAVEALAMVEDARGLKVAGEWGEYGARILAALATCRERDSAAEVEKLREALGALCDKVRYARDREAERGIEECARKAEIFLKNEIRKQFEQ